MIESPPPGGLFGRRAAASAPRHDLDFTVSVVEAHDSDTPVEFLSVDPLAAISKGFSTMLTANGAYFWRGPRVQVGATGASNFRYFNTLEEIKSISHTAGLGVNARVSARTTMALNGSAAYSPSYLYGLFPRNPVSAPGDAIMAAPDYASAHDSESYAYGTFASLTHGLSRRSNLNVGVEIGYTDFTREDATHRDGNSRGLRSGYSRNLGRNTSLNLGYRYRTGTSGYGVSAGSTEVDPLTTEHGVNLGINYARPLSSTREAIFSFNFGSSAVKAPFALNDGAVFRRLVYRFSGDATIDYEFSKAWRLYGAFRRGLDYVADLPEPVFTDGASVGLSGLLTRRLDVFASARYARGEGALQRNNLSFDTSSAEVRLRLALTQSLAAYIQHVYYLYEFTGDAQLLPHLSNGLERNAIRAGVTLWLSPTRN